MAYSSTDISSDELKGYNDDCPMLIGKNLLSATTVTSASFAPIDAASGSTSYNLEYTPLKRVYDGLLDVPCVMDQYRAFTTPTSSNTDAWLSMEVTSLAFDTVIITGHNATSERYKNMEVVVSNSSTFDTYEGVTTRFVSSFDYESPSWRDLIKTNVRMVDTHLSNTANSATTNPQKYSNVDYLAVRWVSENEWFAPRIGELVIGKRLQLRHHPDIEWNDEDYSSTVADLETADGNIIRHTLNKGQAVRKATMVLDSADEIAAVETWWKECNHGKNPFWWIETPKSDPRAYYMQAVNASLDFPQDTGVSARTLTLDMVEQKPFWAWEKKML